MTMPETADRPIKILYCITELDPGGAERALVHLLTHLDRTLFEPLVVTLQSKGELEKRVQELGIDVQTLAMTRSLWSVWWSFWRLRRIISDFNPTIVQSFLIHANLMSRLASWRLGVKLVISGIRVAEKRSRWLLWADRVTESFVDFQICVSQAVRQFSIEQGRLTEKKLMVIPNGVDPQENSEPINLNDWGIPDEARVLLYVGRLDFQKGIDVLVRAMPTILKMEPQAHLLVVGQGNMYDELRACVIQQGTQGHVHFAGYQPSLTGFYRSADCLVLPSRWEGMPNVVLESLSAGLCVLTTRSEGVDDIMSQTHGIELIEAVSEEAVAQAVCRFLNEVKAGRKTQSVTVKWPTWQDISQMYRDFYLGCLKNAE